MEGKSGAEAFVDWRRAFEASERESWAGDEALEVVAVVFGER